MWNSSPITCKYMKIWSSVNKKMTCGIVTFAEISRVSDLGAALHVGLNCK
jgi:hypothetical protein